MDRCETGRHRMPGTALAAFLLASVAFPILASGQPVMAGAASGGVGAAIVARAGLQPYALSDAQLGTIRGGMSLPGGINLTFGFQQLTTVNGTMVLSILVPQISITNSTTSLPVYVYSATSTPQVSQSVTNTPNVPGGNDPATTTTSSTNQTNTSFQETNNTPSGTLTSTPTGTQITVPIATPAITSSTPTGNKYYVPVADPTTTVLTTSTSGNGATSVQTMFSGGGIINGISNSLSNQIIEQTTLMNIGVTGLAESNIAAQTTNRVLNNVTQGFGVP